MNPEFPVERICTHRYEPFQLTFARQAMQRLPARTDALFDASHRGLVLRGKTEAALERPVRVLMGYYGNDIEVGAASVRLHHGSMLEEPFMGLVVLCHAHSAAVVKTDLRSRGGVICDEDGTRQFATIRATAPLAKLLGYAEQLSEIAAGASVIMWLSHYGPVSPKSLDRRNRASIVHEPPRLPAA